ncbi:MAG: peptide chain release factor N(5)-glutamine methyltransferase [Terracidiphilus sp.]|jgi:release factor glutamine methyltransferase
MRLRFGPHRDCARADAELLLLQLLHQDRAWLMAHSSDDIGFDHWNRYYELLERRYNGEPIQYITGETEFYGLPFWVTPDVLIPRPETEHLVEKVIELAAQFKSPRIVDIGSGAGAIAVALAHKLVNVQFTAIDLSADALTIAQENAKRNSANIRFLEGDLLAPVADEQFEIIVSNPPYVPESDRPTLSVEVRDHEPALALFAGPDGLDIYRRLIPQAFAHLVPGGYLALEIGYGQSPAIETLLTDSGFQNIELIPDLQGIPRVASAQHP